MTATDVAAAPASAPAAAPPARMDDLEGYRGIAALGIVIFHAYQFCREGAGGDAAGSSADGYAYAGTPIGHVLLNLDGLVSLFLILSGFLLYLPMARRVRAGESVGVTRSFLLRRTVRILPLYWFAVLLVWTYRNPNLPGDWRDLVEHLTFTQVFDTRRIFYTIGPAWSLSVEIFFYGFLAVVVFALGRWDVRRASARMRTAVILAAPAMLLIASLAYQGWALYVAHEPSDRWAIWFNPLTKGAMFAVGMLLAVTYARWGHHVLPSGVLIPVRLVAVGLLAWGCAFRGDDAQSSTAFNLLAVVAFTLLLGSSVYGAVSARWRRVMAARPLMFAGAISYSVYMWHEPVLLWLDQHHALSHRATEFPLVAAILLAISVPFGWLSYLVIEKPAGELKALFRADGRLRVYYGSAHEG